MQVTFDCHQTWRNDIVIHHVRIAVGILIACVASACASSGAPVAVPGTDEASIPRAALDALRDRWDGVQLGRAGPVSCGSAAVGPEPPLVSGDWNGDGTTDLALWVRTGELSRLVAVFARGGSEYLALEVGEPEVLVTSRLEIMRRASLFRTPALNVDAYLALDTVVSRDCDGSRTAWFWSGDGFRARALLD
jgi:hypothetical protein